MNEFFKELKQAHWLIKILVFGGYIYFWKLIFCFIKEIIRIIREWKNNKKLKEKLVKGYKEKAKLNLKICDDFKFVNGENLGEK